jgi:hypothetical protein
MAEPAQKCSNCGADPLVVRPEDGSCSGCGVDHFVAEVVGGKIALAQALARHHEDVQAFVLELGGLLESAFAEYTEITRKGLFTKHVTQIRVTIRHHVYRLELHGKRPTAHRARHVRGIKLKEEDLPLAAFLAALSADLAAVAAESQEAREALARFVR